MTDDLVKRLRADNDKSFVETLCGEAADRIYALTADRENRLADLRIIKAERDDLKREVAISDALLISEAEVSLERLARAEAAEADNARLLKALTNAGAHLERGLDKMAFHIIRRALNTGKEPSHE